jgi:hypothetical protein
MRKGKVPPGIIGHNGGPALDDPPEHVPEWGRGGFRTYFGWRKAHRAAWRRTPVETMIRRDDKAEAIGLTFEEYTLEILERGRFLQENDHARVAAIKALRRKAPRHDR